tara:strand:- start:745 stop:897 length:153 start_codon:yes stop_codon:yes gene_type:complete
MKLGHQYDVKKIFLSTVIGIPTNRRFFWCIGAIPEIDASASIGQFDWIDE